MGADADHHQPGLAILAGAVLVGGWRVLGKIGVARDRIDEIVERHGLGLLDLLLGAVADEDRLAAPHHRDRLALLHRRKIDFGRRHRQRRGVRIHLIEQRPQPEAETDRGEAAGGDHDHVAPGRVLFIGKGKLRGSSLRAVGQLPELLIANGPVRPDFAETDVQRPPPKGRRRYILGLKALPLLCRPRLTASMAPLAFLHPRLGLSRTTPRSNWRSAQKPSEQDRRSIPGRENLDFGQGRT